MEQNNNQRQVVDLTKEEFYKVSLWGLAIACAIFIVGAMLGWALTSMSYQKAFADGEVHICTAEEIEYQEAIFALNDCRIALEKGGFSYTINMSNSLLTD